MTRPSPTSDELSAPFFEGTANGVLMLQRCRNCAKYAFPVQEICTNCLEGDLEWVESSGEGTLHTFGVMHHLYHPGFARDLPYNVAVVELTEGPSDELEVGMELKATFEPAGEVMVPVFQPA